MSLKEELRAEMLETCRAFHDLLDEIPEEAFARPSDNPAWTIGEVLFHMSLAPRFMVTDLRAILAQAWLARVFALPVPAVLFHRLNEFYTRRGARHLNRRFLAKAYDRAHERALRSLEALREEDFQKSLLYPGYDPLLSGDVTVEKLFRYIKQHFEHHAGQIRERLDGILV